MAFKMKGYTPYDKTALKDYSLEKGSHSHPHGDTPAKHTTENVLGKEVEVGAHSHLPQSPVHGEKQTLRPKSSITASGSATKKTGPDDGPHPDRKTNISVEVVSVQPDGGNMMVRVPGVGVRKVSGGAAGIAEIKEGSTVKVNIGAGNKVTLASPKDEDTKRTGGPRTKGKQPGPRA